ncbi:hypothetical protein ABER23_32390, partial [Paenibacillus lautus]|uniref:hypothetical protein n=1 Tax=Paenibacillus lautus TaxID=1401 RepID=UPI003D2987BB
FNVPPKWPVLLTRCSVFKDQSVFLVRRSHLSGDFYNISYFLSTLQALFLKKFFEVCFEV